MRTKDSQFAAATRAHALRVAAWSSEIARRLGLPAPDQELVRETAIVHHYPLDCLEESGLARLGRDLGLPLAAANGSSKPAPAVYALLQTMRTCGDSNPHLRLLTGIIEVANFWDEQLEFSPFSDQPLAGVLDRTIAEGRQIGFSAESLEGLSGLKLAGPTALAEALNLLPAARPRGLLPAQDGVMLPLRELFCAAGMRGLWEHSVSAARLASRMAAESGRVSKDDAYAAGLVHDIGRIPIALLGSQVTSTIERLCTAGCLPITAELSVCGFDHPEAGAKLLERWEFPQFMIDAVRWHHEPERHDHALAGLLYLVEQHLGVGEDLASPVRMALSLRAAGLDEETVM